MNELRVSVLLLVALITACAGGGMPAPIEQRGGVDPHAVPGVARGAEASPSPGTVAIPVELAAPADAVQVPEELDEASALEAGAEADPSVLALATPAEPPRPLRHPTAQNLLEAATAAAARGEWERAQAALERAVKVAPDDNDLWRQLAYTHFRQGAHPQALQFAHRSLEGTPSAPMAAASWRLIADIEDARGNVAAAAEARRRAEHGP